MIRKMRPIRRKIHDAVYREGILTVLSTSQDSRGVEQFFARSDYVQFLAITPAIQKLPKDYSFTTSVRQLLNSPNSTVFDCFAAKHYPTTSFYHSRLPIGFHWEICLQNSPVETPGMWSFISAWPPAARTFVLLFRPVFDRQCFGTVSVLNRLKENFPY